MTMSSQTTDQGDGFNNNYFDPAADLIFNRMMIINNTSRDGYFQPFSSSVDLSLGQESMKMIAKEVKSELDMLNINNSSNNGGWSSCPSASPTAARQFISFGSSHQVLFDCNYNTGIISVQPNDHGLKLPVNDHEDVDRGTYMGVANCNYNNLSHQKQRNRRVGGMSLCSQEHVLDERKRREIMTQRFLALSALIPGLNKTDKASILGDAAKYLKELEELVKLLEEQTTQRTVECALLMKTKRNPDLDYVNSLSYDSFNNKSTNNPLLEIEARAKNNNLLNNPLLEKDQRLVQKVLNEIEKLNLTTLNCSTMPFGGYAINITSIAQMNDDLCMGVEEMVMHLRQVLQHFLCYSH